MRLFRTTFFNPILAEAEPDLSLYISIYAQSMFSCVKDLTVFLWNHCILVDSSTVIYWTSPFVILEVSDPFCRFYSVIDGKPF